jgi:glycogen operon protein
MNPLPLGARFSADKTQLTFCICSLNATRVEAWIYGAPVGAAPILSQSMQAGGVTGAFTATIAVSALGGAQTVYYGYRAWGPNWPYDASWTPGSQAGFVSDVDGNGNRFNPNKLLLDPYALEVSHNPITPTQQDIGVYQSGATNRLVDTGPVAPKGIAIALPALDFGVKPVRPFKDEIIYEVHLRGLTKDDPSVPASLQGTYAGAAMRAAYLASLGITAVEFQPIHETQNALNDVTSFSANQNYWGYDSVSYFAPDRRYASDQSPGGPTQEWMGMVKAYHNAGLKVYLDVVYNHHNEGGVDSSGTIGTIYSLRGLDNTNYYETLVGLGQPAQYEDDNGVGPNVNAAVSLTGNLILDSLKYWAATLGVDGFRFDLAAVLGNTKSQGGYSFDLSSPQNVINRVVSELPARPAAGGQGVDLIAEPYTANGQGQEQGQFPPGWAEWNDRYRDTFRASQNKLGFVAVTPGQMATRFAGSNDLFQANGRKPWNSVNYITCHDGMTLRDLHSFEQTQNDLPFPKGPSSGGRSAADEMCWDHGGDPVQQIQAVRTSLAILLLSAGVPMVSGGTEIFRTQFGNNNAFNLDTNANWLDWSQLLPEAALVNFAPQLFLFRLAHSCLRPPDFFTGTDTTGDGLKDLTWVKNDGSEVDPPYFQNSDNHFLAFRIDGTKFGDTAASLYIAYNGWIAPVSANLPANLPGKQWFLVADTASTAEAWGNIHPPGQEAAMGNSVYNVMGRSLVLCLEK